MDTFLARYPEYERTRLIDELRSTEYPQLDRDGGVYLDYTGAGVVSQSQIAAHAARVAGGCYGNPHSDNPTSQASSTLIATARKAVLDYLNASPTEYAVIFTANATAACRLVGEAYPFARSRPLVLTFDNHNSVNGIREFARARGARCRYVPVSPPELRIDERDLVAALRTARHGLFAFPAQSNFSGVQHPVRWIELAHQYGYDVLLDAAAYLPTNRLDLAEVGPDFVAISWYKVLGYPTGLGCLVARWPALARLRRPWFAGGTITAVSVQGDWHQMSPDEAAFEDGTLNFLAIPDVECGLSWIDSIGIDTVHTRVGCLTGWLLHRMSELRHSNGAQMLRVYGPTDERDRGGTISFNVLDPDGRVVDDRLVARESAARGFSLRTGCFCNPGAGEGAFGITKRALRGSRRWRLHSLDEYLSLLGIPAAGAVRASFGIASTLEDAERLLDFLGTTYLDRVPDRTGLVPRDRC